jgi:hypothetical protein
MRRSNASCCDTRYFTAAPMGLVAVFGPVDSHGAGRTATAELPIGKDAKCQKRESNLQTHVMVAYGSVHSMQCHAPLEANAPHPFADFRI